MVRRPDAGPDDRDAARGARLRRAVADFPEKLAAATGHGVFVYSRAGYGRSDPVDLPRPLDYMTREARKSLPEGARRDRLSARHSARPQRRRLDRGDLCRRACGRRVKGLVLMAPHVFTEERASPRSRRRSAATRRANCARGSPNITPMSTAPSSDGTAPGSIPASRPGTSKISSAAGGFRRCSFRARTISTERWRRSARSKPARTSPVESLILEGCRHSPHLERPEATLDAAARFCSEILGRAR